MNYTEYFLLFSSVIGGGLAAFYFKKSNAKVLQMILSFSGAYILAITVLHFLPSVFAGHNHHIGLYILLGFLIQIVLEQLSVGIEPGIFILHLMVKTDLRCKSWWGCVYTLL